MGPKLEWAQHLINLYIKVLCHQTLGAEVVYAGEGGYATEFFGELEAAHGVSREHFLIQINQKLDWTPFETVLQGLYNPHGAAAYPPLLFVQRTLTAAVVADDPFDGRCLRLLTIVDNFSRVNPFIGVGYCYKGYDVVLTLNLAVARYAVPEPIQADNSL